MQEDHAPARRNAAARLSARFCALLAQRFRTGAPMADYAADLDVTPTHLTRAVKAATGKTAADLLTERVLHEARMLLAKHAHPARQIAASPRLWLCGLFHPLYATTHRPSPQQAAQPLVTRRSQRARKKCRF